MQRIYCLLFFLLVGPIVSCGGDDNSVGPDGLLSWTQQDSGYNRWIFDVVLSALVGELDKAIDILEELLSIPSDLTVAVFRLDPFDDSLRNHPRFQALLKQGDKVF